MASPAVPAAPPATRFMLPTDEEPGAGLLRVLSEQVALADWHLTRADIGPIDVHEARKACKRIRAVARMARDDLPAGVYRAVNVEVRDAARLISQARSATTIGVTLRTVSEAMKWPEVGPSGWLRLFAAEADERLARLEADLIGRLALAARLHEAGRVFASWSPAPDFSPLRAGMMRVYRRGRRAMAKALADPTEERFHEWRKRVKYLQYQTELLACGLPGPITEISEQAHQLGEELGLEHDLSDLRKAIEEHRAAAGNTLTPDEVLAAAAARRSELRASISTVGAEVYAMQPEVFVTRLEAARREMSAFTRPAEPGAPR